MSHKGLAASMLGCAAVPLLMARRLPCGGANNVLPLSLCPFPGDGELHNVSKGKQADDRMSEEIKCIVQLK